MFQTIGAYNINKKGKQVNYNNVDKGSVNFDGKMGLSKIENQEGTYYDTFRKNEIVIPQNKTPS